MKQICHSQIIFRLKIPAERILENAEHLLLDSSELHF